MRKLGIRAGERIIAIGRPEHYEDLLDVLPPDVAITERLSAGAAFVHLFVTRRADLEKRLVTLRKKLADAGVLWVSWPKKASGVATDVTEDTIREVALPLGFVDVKVCAVDETWSGLKLMISAGEPHIGDEVRDFSTSLDMTAGVQKEEQQI